MVDAFYPLTGSRFPKFSLFQYGCDKAKLVYESSSKSIYFSRDSLCFIYFDIIIRQRLKKKFKLVELFFQSRERNKNMWSCATTDTGHAQRSYLTVARL